MDLRALLNFPRQFAVDKRMNKEIFLKHANLTKRESAFLDAYMKDIDILFDIAFPNRSEMLVLYTEALRPDLYSDYFMRTYVTFIAQSFPYDCLLVVQFCGLLKFYIFDERINKLNISRSVIEQWNATESIHFTPHTSPEETIIQKLRKELSWARSASDLHERWKQVVKEHRGSCEMFDRFHKTPLNAIQRTDILESIIEKNASQRFRSKTVSDEVESDIFDGISLDPNNNAEERAFIQFCAVHCRTLYNEARKDAWQEFTGQDWLLEYIAACNRYSQEIFNKSIDSECVFPIKMYFWEGYESSPQEYYFFDADVLRDYLWRFF